MRYSCVAFLDGEMGRTVVRHAFATKEKAERWCKRQLARHEFRKRSAEVKDTRTNAVCWSGQGFVPKTTAESVNSVTAAQGDN